MFERAGGLTMTWYLTRVRSFTAAGCRIDILLLLLLEAHPRCFSILLLFRFSQFILHSMPNTAPVLVRPKERREEAPAAVAETQATINSFPYDAQAANSIPSH